MVPGDELIAYSAGRGIGKSSIQLRDLRPKDEVRRLGVTDQALSPTGKTPSDGNARVVKDLDVFPPSGTRMALACRPSIRRYSRPMSHRRGCLKSRVSTGLP